MYSIRGETASRVKQRTSPSPILRRVRKRGTYLCIFIAHNYVQGNSTVYIGRFVCPYPHPALTGRPRAAAIPCQRHGKCISFPSIVPGLLRHASPRWHRARGRGEERRGAGVDTLRMRAAAAKPGDLYTCCELRRHSPRDDGDEVCAEHIYIQTIPHSYKAHHSQMFAKLEKTIRNPEIFANMRIVFFRTLGVVRDVMVSY